MIDLHSHILAGIDDGAVSLDDSIALIEGALSEGVCKILATPHIHLGTFDNDLFSIEQAFNALTKQLAFQHQQQTSPQLTSSSFSLAYAAEVRIGPEIINLIQSNRIPFMGKWQGDDLLLLELPHSHIPPGSENLIDWLIEHHIQTVIAHPERNRDAWAFPERLEVLQERGCLFQITAASLLGDFGPRSKSLAWDMLKKDQVSLVASDMHNQKRRPCKMKDAFRAVRIRFGDEVAHRLFVATPDLIFQSNPTIWTNQ
jgi:protein-tyrosine phosphatase